MTHKDMDGNVISKLLCTVAELEVLINCTQPTLIVQTQLDIAWSDPLIRFARSTLQQKVQARVVLRSTADHVSSGLIRW